jgi:hypothetical protein
MLTKTRKRPSPVAADQHDFPAEDQSDVSVTEQITIPPIRIKRATFILRGVTQLVANKFSQEMQNIMSEKQKKGSQAKKGTKREAKDFEKDFRGSLHVSTEGWCGLPASALRQAMVDACRAVGYKMTVAKMGVFVLADGEDIDSGQPLVRIWGLHETADSKPVKVDAKNLSSRKDNLEMFSAYVRLANGAPDIKSRGRWKKWRLDLTVEFDEDMFSTADIINLLVRVGRQVGVGAGRPFSKTSCGQDWGRFEVQGMLHVESLQVNTNTGEREPS